MKPAANSAIRRSLTPAQSKKLETIRIGQRMSFRRMLTWMNAPFSIGTLRAAIAGKPLWKPNHDFLVKFLKQLDQPLTEGSKSNVSARTGTI